MTTRSLSYTQTGSPPALPLEGEVLRRAATENFKVASRLLPSSARHHLIAFYGFARLVDEIGDAYTGDRLEALERIERQTAAAVTGRPEADTHVLVSRATRSIADLGLDPSPLFRLIEANRLDQRNPEYQTFEDLLGYCALSANPVGELVLGAFGVSNTERVGFSDSICTGLQLAEHWQDVAEDAALGRVYIPSQDLRRFGVTACELVGAQSASPAAKALMAFEVARARRVLDEGLPLLASLSGRFRWAVAGFWAGGRAALDAVADNGFDPSRDATRPRARRVAVHMLDALTGRAAKAEAA